MILGLSHIIENRATAVETSVESPGVTYALKFKQNNVPVPQGKKKLLRGCYSEHSLHFYESETNLSVEFTHYDRCPGVSCSRVKIDGARLFLKTNEFEKDREFFTKFLKFKSEEDAPDFLFFRSPISRWSVGIVLVNTNSEVENIYLDDIGYTCLSFWVKNMKDVVETLPENLLQVDNLKLNVNNRNLKICFYTTPSGMPIEFIEVERNR